jgi:hypothetical protein
MSGETKEFKMLDREGQPVDLTKDEEAQNEMVQSWMQQQADVILLLKMAGIMVSILLGSLMSAFSHEQYRPAEEKTIMRDMGYFFWVATIVFAWLLRREFRAVIVGGWEALKSLATFMRIWRHTVINGIFLLFASGMTAMTICLVDKPALQLNPIFLAFFAICGIVAIVSFCFGGYNILCVVCK